MPGQSRPKSDGHLKVARRALVLGGLQAAGFGLLGWRLFKIQVVDAARYAPMAEDNRVNLQVLAPKRGRILDRSGVVLAGNDESYRATLVPALAGDVPSVLKLFRQIVAVPQDEVEKIARRAKRQSRSTPIVIRNELSFEDVARINLHAPQLPGIRTETAWKRSYAYGPATGHVIGYVGSVERPKAEGDAVLRLPGMKIGKSGIEAAFDNELRGQGGTQKIEVDARGHPVRSLGSVEAVAGTDVALTIDAALQQRLQAMLEGHKRASAVVLDVRTGGITAMVSAPAFEPAAIAEGLSDEDWQRLGSSDDKPLLNRAISGQYQPGSIVKVVAALAALDAGVADPAEKIACNGSLELDGQTYPCSHRAGHGRLTMTEALQKSCDVYFFELARRAGIERLAATARNLGLGQTFECGLSQQKAGVVPDPIWKRARWNMEWLSADTIATGAGQGYALANPLQLAVLMARVAAKRMIEPALALHAIRSQSVQSPLPYQGAVLDVLRRTLDSVAAEDDGSTGTSKSGDRLPRVAGLSGTAEVTARSETTPEEALEWAKRDHALFAGYAPAADPRYSVSVVVEHGGGQGEPAASLAREVIAAVLAAEHASGASAVTGNADRKG